MARHVSWAAWLVLLLAAMSCGDDDPNRCGDIDEGCAEGLSCQVGPDGREGCFCNADADTGCGDGLECQVVEGAAPECFCSPRGQSGCADGEVCEEVVDGNSGCFPPVTVSGNVFDLTNDDPVEGAHVVARDANNVAVSDVAVTDAAGNYDLVVLTKRTREGALAKTEVRLRADAAGYVTFPTAPRFAVPFDTSNASGDPPVLSSSATDVGLLPLPSTAGLGTITGKVIADRPRGTLVVAGGDVDNGGGATGIAAFDGVYTVFNVPAGNVAVQGYLAGLQLDGTSATVTEGDVTTDVNLEAIGEAIAIVSGKIEIVNPGMGKDSSVIMVVEETFVANTASGESPPGLRAYPVAGAFVIENVPDGNYVMLAAFENDFLVRDPDTSIGGTDIVRISVSGDNVDISEGFKVTGSLDVVSPDAEEIVSGTPTFIWSDDSSEDHYEIEVYDAFGNLVWSRDDIPNVTGSATVEVTYEGPALESGLLYQFRATSIKNNGTPIARTEDLRGVFLFR